MLVAIVYNYHLPSDIEPMAPVRWDALDTDGMPKRVGVVPHIIEIDSAQEAIRAIAPRLNEVVALQVIDTALAPELEYITEIGHELPRTFVGTYERTAQSAFSGVVKTSSGVTMEVKPGDTVLRAEDVRLTLAKPRHKCGDQVMVAYADTIRQGNATRRFFPEEGVAHQARVPNIGRYPSCTVITPATMARITRKDSFATRPSITSISAASQPLHQGHADYDN